METIIIRSQRLVSHDFPTFLFVSRKTFMENIKPEKLHFIAC